MAGEEEKICFEHVDFSALNPGDEHPLGQPGVMAGAVMFDFLICEEASPYTRTNMLAVCPSELRAKPTVTRGRVCGGETKTRSLVMGRRREAHAFEREA